MNNQRLQFTLAVLLLLGIFGLTTLMLVHPVTISPDAKAMIEGLIGQLIAVFVFVSHAIFAHPTTPETPAPNGVSK